jgi:hypothetical protein
MDKKARIASSNSGWQCRGEKWSQWRWWWWVRTSHADQKSMWERFGVLRVKRQKLGLNRRPNAYTAGPHPLPNLMMGEMDGQHDTCEGSSRSPGALLEILKISHDCSIPNILYIIIFVSGEDEYSQDRFPAIQLRWAILTDLHISKLYLYTTWVLGQQHSSNALAFKGNVSYGWDWL